MNHFFDGYRSDEARYRHPLFDLKRRRVLITVCLTLVLVEAIAIVGCYIQERIDLHIHSGDVTLQRDLTGGRLAFYAPGVEVPPVRSALNSRIADHERILGVEINGKFQAYRILAMSNKYNHVINDVINDHPVSVTYCDINDFACGFTGESPGTPLPIAQGGLFSGGIMVLCVAGIEYAQQTLKSSTPGALVPSFPFEPISSTRTTWEQWRSQHPETDVFEEASER